MFIPFWLIALGMLLALAYLWNRDPDSFKIWTLMVALVAALLASVAVGVALLVVSSDMAAEGNWGRAIAFASPCIVVAFLLGRQGLERLRRGVDSDSSDLPESDLVGPELDPVSELALDRHIFAFICATRVLENQRREKAPVLPAVSLAKVTPLGASRLTGLPAISFSATPSRAKFPVFTFEVNGRDFAIGIETIRRDSGSPRPYQNCVVTVVKLPAEVVLKMTLKCGLETAAGATTPVLLDTRIEHFCVGAWAQAFAKRLGDVCEAQH